MGGFEQAILGMARVNMGLCDGESLLVVADVPGLAQWAGDPATLEEIIARAAFAKEACAILKDGLPGKANVSFAAFYATGMPGTEPPEEIARLLLAYDVSVAMTTYSLSHTDAREGASAAGRRIASMPGILRSMFAEGGPMAADYPSVKRDSEMMAKLLTDGSAVRIGTDAGTDITFSIAGRKGIADTGIFTQAGEWGNLPAGEAYIAPVEGTASGALVVQAGWYPRLEEDMRIVFRDGLATEVIGGGSVGDRFRRALFEEGATHRRNCAELGVGTNPLAKRTDNVLEAEKIKGTVHIAIGDSAHMGGMNVSDMHEDFVLRAPRLYIDGSLASL